MKRLPYSFNFYLVYPGILSVGTELSLKNPSHLVLISRDFHPLVLSDNLNGREADWMHKLKISELSCCDAKSIWYVL
jgi:hypothetical protein